MTQRSPMLRPGIRRLLGLDIQRSDRIAAELDDELQLHLELRARQLMTRGLSAEVAMSQARTQYGDVAGASKEILAHAKRSEQRMQRRISLDSLTQDVRFAVRTLLRSKSWTAVAVLTLALGIGANTAVFSVINDLLLDPLRYPAANRLVVLTRANEKAGLEIAPSRELLEVWKSARTLDGVEGVGTADLPLMTGGEPTTARVGLISATFTTFAGSRVLVGRSFTTGEDKEGAPPVALLSEHIWRSRFAGDANVVGKTVTIDDKERTIVGVMPDGVRIPAYSTEAVDVWAPLTGGLSGPVVARIKPGIDIAVAREELTTLAKSVVPKTAVGTMPFGIRLRAPGSSGQTRMSIFMLAGAVCLLLLIACANVAHLLLARGAARERELSIRAALGAGRGRIVRQLVTESLILAAAGCVGGLAIGMMALRVIVAQRPQNMGELANVHLDARVLLVTIALSVVTGLAFGLVAAFTNRGGRSFEVLRSSVTGTGDKRRNRLRSLLVITENALSVVLLVGAALLIRTVVNLYQINPGFDATNVYSMVVNLPKSRYPDATTRKQFADRLLADALRVPGVENATIAESGPTRAGIMFGDLEAEGATAAPSKGNGGFSAMNTVRPDYFSVLRMPLLSGHQFDLNSKNNNDVIISLSMAKRFWHSAADAVGRRFREPEGNKPHEPGPWMTVAGVVSDAALLALHDDHSSAIYFPASEAPDSYMTLLVRMRGDNSPTAALRRASIAIDPALPPQAALPLTELLLRTVASQKFMMSLLTLFAGLAVILSAVGLYGVITYMVSQSTREIGVRVALGAARRDVITLVMRQGVALSAIGLVIGLLASVWGAKLLSSSLYGVTATDPLSYVAGATVLLLLAMAACVAPTMRAIRIDPMVAMRSE